jgi:hypothetical protein
MHKPEVHVGKSGLLRADTRHEERIAKALHIANERKGRLMKRSIKLVFGGLVLLVSLTSLIVSAAPGARQETTPKQDIKDAGKSTKEAGKKTGSATKEESKKIVHKSAQKTKEGANKVEEKTEPKQ